MSPATVKPLLTGKVVTAAQLLQSILARTNYSIFNLWINLYIHEMVILWDSVPACIGVGCFAYLASSYMP
jgi:hypothetical protein